MNICIITSSYPLNPGDASASAGVFVKDFALELARRGNKVHVLTQQKKGTAIDDKEINIVRFPWRGGNKRLSTLKLNNLKDLIDMVSLVLNGKKALFNLIRKEKIHLIIAMWAVPCGGLAYLAHRKFGTPYITWTLGSDIWVYGRNKITRPIIKAILKSSSKIYADGKVLMRETQNIAGKECAFLPTTRILPKDNLPDIELDKGRKHFLYIGRYHPNKGTDVLIDAINLIPRDILGNMYFHVFGGGELEEALKQKVSEYELERYVSINGYITPEYAAAYLKKAQALIIPSRIESIPIVLSDALQCDCPIIATDTGDMGELLKNNNVGKIAEPENPKMLSEKIIEFLDADRNDYKDRIRKLYELFNMSNIVEKISGSFSEYNNPV